MLDIQSRTYGYPFDFKGLGTARSGGTVYNYDGSDAEAVGRGIRMYVGLL